MKKNGNNNLGKLICRLTARLASMNMPYNDLLAEYLTKKQYQSVQTYLADHMVYPELDTDWNDLIIEEE